MRYALDIPVGADRVWTNVGCFDTRDDAAAYAKEKFGADDEERRHLIPECEDRYDGLELDPDHREYALKLGRLILARAGLDDPNREIDGATAGRLIERVRDSVTIADAVAMIMSEVQENRA